MNCNYADNEGKGCTANDGEPCESCAAKEIEEMRYWSRLYEVATLEEKDPEAYRRNLIESGRGHLLSTVAKWEDV